MTNEYITKQQAIDLVKSLEVVLGCLGMSVLTRELERLETEKSGWISVKDRLPEPFVTVIVQMPLETPLPTVGWGFIEGNGKWYCNYFKREEDEVTHWMPMPEPPKE